jgi:hypothetical protein
VLWGTAGIANAVHAGVDTISVGLVHGGQDQTIEIMGAGGVGEGLLLVQVIVRRADKDASASTAVGLGQAMADSLKDAVEHLVTQLGDEQADRVRAARA